MGGNKNPQYCWVCGISVRSPSPHRKTAAHLANVNVKAPLPEGFLTRFREVAEKGIPRTKQLEVIRSKA